MVKPENSPFKSLSPEDCAAGILYTFTYNPCDKHQFWSEDDPKVRFMKVYGAIREVLSYFNDYYQVEACLEVSKAGRVHAHGTVEFKDVFGFFMSAIPHLKKYGTYEIDKIENLQTWQDYCKKQKDLVYDVGLFFYIDNKKDPVELGAIQDANNKKRDYVGLQKFGFNIGTEQYMEPPIPAAEYPTQIVKLSKAKAAKLAKQVEEFQKAIDYPNC